MLFAEVEMFNQKLNLNMRSRATPVPTGLIRNHLAQPITFPDQPALESSRGFASTGAALVSAATIALISSGWSGGLK
jgi:hypothetical protein